MEQFATPAPIAVVLGVPAGRIRLIAADREDTVVEVLPADRSKGRDAEAARRALVSYEAGVLRVEIPEGKRSGLIGGSAGAVEVTVRTPAVPAWRRSWRMPSSGGSAGWARSSWRRPVRR